MAVEHNPSLSEGAPPQINAKRQGDLAYAMHRIEAGDSSASSGGEGSPSPRVQSVALNSAMCWNGISNNNNSHVKKGHPPDEAVDVGVKHSSEPSVPLPPHKVEEISTAAVKRRALRYQQWCRSSRGTPFCEGQHRKSVDSRRKHRRNTQGASDRLSTSSLKSTASSSSQSSPSTSHRPRSRKQSCLESMGIVEDTEGGSCAV